MTQEEKMQREDFRRRLLDHDSSAEEKQRAAEEAARRKQLEDPRHKREVFNAGEKVWSRMARREGWTYNKREADEETLNNVHPVW